MLDNNQIEKNFERFVNLLDSNIKRDGIDKLIAWLKSKDTKIAPASAKYHLAVPGGLVSHLLNTYDRLEKLIKLQYPTDCPYSEETVTLVALLHDISKVGLYEVKEKNTKDESGNWIKVPYYQTKEFENRLVVFGSRSMNSLYMINKFMKLSYQEELAILYCMGGFDVSEDTLSVKNVSEAFLKSPLALLLHQADAQATYLDDKVNE